MFQENFQKKTVEILKEIKKLKSFKEKLPYLIKVESKLIFYFFGFFTIFESSNIVIIQYKILYQTK